MRVALAALLVAAVGSHGCTTTCTLVGCTSSVRVSIEPITDPARYLGATVTLCMNEVCGDSALPDAVPDPGSGVGGTPSGELAVDAQLQHFEAHYTVSIELPDYGTIPFEDGDEYTLEIRDRGDNVILQHDWIAQYEVSSPNGEGCGPRCRNHTLELTAP